MLNQSKSPSAAPVKTISGETSIARKRKTVRLPALRKPIFFNKFLLDEHFTIFTPFFPETKSYSNAYDAHIFCMKISYSERQNKMCFLY